MIKTTTDIYNTLKIIEKGKQSQKELEDIIIKNYKTIYEYVDIDQVQFIFNEKDNTVNITLLNNECFEFREVDDFTINANDIVDTISFKKAFLSAKNDELEM